MWYNLSYMCMDKDFGQFSTDFSHQKLHFMLLLKSNKIAVDFSRSTIFL